MRPLSRLAATLLLLSSPGAAAAAAAPAAPVAPALVSGEWLHANLEAGDLVLVDARPAGDFASAQLPGARSVAVEELRVTTGDGPPASHPPEILSATFARAGVTRRSHVVVYGSESDLRATYVATAARIAGAERVSVLDGGFARWQREGRPVADAPSVFSPAKPDLEADTSFLVSIEEVRKRVGEGKTVFLDVRPEPQFRAGHVPGAKNRFWKKDVVDGSFRPAAEIRAELEALGVSWERPVVVYCNSGNQASESFHMLRYALGHPDVRLFQGSWREEPATVNGTDGAAPAATK